jgi:hypothetical protein
MIKRVVINGTNYNDQVIEGLNITYGKQRIFEQVRSPYATISLVQGSNSIAFEINDSVVVEAQLTTSTWVPLFTGEISDVSTSLAAPDFAVTTITAVGTLGRAAQGLAGAEGYPEQTAGERVAQILSDGLNYVIIDGIPGTIDSQTGTIDSWFGYSVGLPFLSGFTLEAMPAEEQNALSLATTFAEQVSGHIIEDTDGSLRFENYGYNYNLQILATGETTLQDSLEGNLNTDELNNILTLTAPGYSRTFANSSSVGSYGSRPTELDTNILATTTDLNNYGAWVLARQAFVNRRISQITLDLDAVLNQSTTRYNNLLQLEFFQMIQVQDLPLILTGSDEYDGYAAGWTWRIGRNFAEIAIDLVKEY